MVKQYILSFEKDKDGSWYIIVPEYPGNRSELQMVAGADIALDKLSNGTNLVRLSCYTSFKLLTHYKAIHTGYGNYTCSLLNDFWLCEVTKYIFGEYPDEIYFKVIRG